MTGDAPQPPIFCAEGGDVSCHASAEAFARHLEGPDVLAGTYRAFDAVGRPLMLSTDGDAQGYSARVYVSLSPAPPDPDALRQILAPVLTRNGVASTPAVSLEALTAEAASLLGLRPSSR